jgi:hypothetical protein
VFRDKKEVLGKNWPDMNETLVCRKIINYTNRTQIKNTGQYLN